MKATSSRALIGVALVGTLLAAWFAPEPATDGLALTDKAKAAGSRANAAPVGSTVGSAAAPGATSATNMANTANAAGVPTTARTGESVQVLALHPRDGQGADGLSEAGWLGVATARPVAAPVATRVVETPPPLSTAPATAPALPFRAFGRYVDGGEDVVFLMLNDQNLAVRVGDTIAEQYRVERLEGQTLTLRYLPLDVLQTLDVGGKN